MKFMIKYGLYVMKIHRLNTLHYLLMDLEGEV